MILNVWRHATIILIIYNISTSNQASVHCIRWLYTVWIHYLIMSFVTPHFKHVQTTWWWHHLWIQWVTNKIEGSVSFSGNLGFSWFWTYYVLMNHANNITLYVTKYKHICSIYFICMIIKPVFIRCYHFYIYCSFKKYD